MVTANILDSVKSELDARIWDHPADPEPVLKPVVAQFIKTKIYHTLEAHGYSNPHEWLNLCVTGSLTTYQYSDDSDMDVSLFVNAEKLPEWSRAEMIGLMVSEVDGTKIPLTPFPLQDFVVGKKLKPADLYREGLRSGYDIDQGRWIIPPDHSQVMDVESQENGFYVYALQMADKMHRLLQYEPDKAVQFWHQIHARRQRDQAKGKGDFSEANITYKFLANRGLMPAIAEASGEHIAKTAAPSVGPSWSWPDPNAGKLKRPVWQPGQNKLEWTLGSPGKGFILHDGTVHTWNTQNMMPVHSQQETAARMQEAPPVKRGSEFHIEPTGRVWQFGPGRSLDEGDRNVIQRTPTIWCGEQQLPSAPVQADQFGHAMALISALDHQGALDANAGQDLQGLPGPVNVSGQGPLHFHSNADIQRIANEYNQANGLGPHPTNYLPINQATSQQVAQEYDRVQHAPQDAQVANAYQSLANETRAQYDHAVNNGYQFEFYPTDHDPYPNSPREALLDLHHDKHMYVYPTAAGFGQDDTPDHPLMADSGVQWNGQPVTHNDLFRAIHDFYGHAKEGIGFRATGEDNAYRQHQAMFTPPAQQALASETRGQNSWVNYGPYGQQNQTAGQGDTVYAQQKAGIMPDWTTDPDLHRPAQPTAAPTYEGIVRDGGRHHHIHDRDDPCESSEVWPVVDSAE